MNVHTTMIVPSTDTHVDQRREVTLAWLRVLDARMLMFRNELSYIGATLKAGWVEPDDALMWLDEIDPALLDLIGGAGQ
jgi:hypothetical protein